MADSDDEDYKRRDKFRSERRSGYEDRGGHSPEGGGGGTGGGGTSSSAPSGGGGGGGSSGGANRWRDARPGPPSWNNRDGGGGRGRDYYQGGGGGGGGGYRRDRYSPPPRGGRSEMSPPHKRMRGGGEWEDRGYHGSGGGGGGGGYGSYGRGNDDYGGGGAPPRSNFSGRLGVSSGGGGGGGSSSHHHNDDSVQPPMMSFKSFLGTQEDSISDDEAIRKYAEYKLEFKRQQLNEFFVNHKDEEWFKLKYHPEDSVKRREELKSSLMKRVEVFQDFWTQQIFQGASMDQDQVDKLVRILDSVVIMLEGGTELDLKILDIEERNNSAAELERKNAAAAAAATAAAAAASSASSAAATAEVKDETKVKEEQDDDPDKPAKAEISEEQLELQKKAKEYLEAKAGTAAEATDGAEVGEGGQKGKKRKRTKEYDDDEDNSSSSEEEEQEDEEMPPGKEKKDEDESKKSNGVASSADNADGEAMDAKDDDEGKKAKDDEKMAEGEEEVESDSKEAKPRALHRTTSIFLRNLAPTITKQEVEAICKRYPGFLRASIADPAPDRRWFRRGWVTFERDVKIKEICYNLNNIRLREFEIGPIVNRDLTRRIRTVTGITVDKKVVRSDIKMAAKVITNLDRRWGLWQTKSENAENGGGKAKADESNGKNHNNEDEMIGLGSSNPVLDNITDYLIEEASAEEEELLGKNSELEDGEEGEEGNSIVRDEELVKVLDRLLFYLRVVHSVDFYNHSEYPNEDEMPNRCGIMHARGSPPTGNVTQAEIDDYCATFEKKMGSFLQPRALLNDEDAAKLGMKNEDDEVEKFVQANTQELGKDKWLCPLSGKKFKGPDFVRKHIFNKHAEKVEEVKKEVQYYNSYLKDPRRPQLPENPQNKNLGGGGGGRREAPPAPSHRADSGFPREATSYPVYEDRNNRGGDSRGYNESRYDRSYRGGGGGGGGMMNRRPINDGGGGYGRGRIRDRVGPHPALRVTQYEADPRGVIDYSDVDLNVDADFF